MCFPGQQRDTYQCLLLQKPVSILLLHLRSNNANYVEKEEHWSKKLRWWSLSIPTIKVDLLWHFCYETYLLKKTNKQKPSNNKNQAGDKY